jgi:hypothetical protein
LTYRRWLGGLAAFAQLVSKDCPAAGFGSMVPDACPPACASNFMPWWRNCGAIPELASVAHLTEAFSGFEAVCAAAAAGGGGGH